jgi:hypothetical protein
MYALDNRQQLTGRWGWLLLLPADHRRLPWYIGLGSGSARSGASWWPETPGKPFKFFVVIGLMLHQCANVEPNETELVRSLNAALGHQVIHGQ